MFGKKMKKFAGKFYYYHPSNEKIGWIEISLEQIASRVDSTLLNEIVEKGKIGQSVNVGTYKYQYAPN